MLDDAHQEDANLWLLNGGQVGHDHVTASGPKASNVAKSGFSRGGTKIYTER
jgi:hypothetical protein